MNENLVPGSPQRLHSGATSGNGGILYCAGAVARVTVVVQGTGTLSTGAITLEEAYYDLVNGDPVYSGTWSAIGTAINASTVTGGQQSVTHLAGSFWAVRARISTAATGGGTLDVWAWGN